MVRRIILIVALLGDVGTVTRAVVPGGLREAGQRGDAAEVQRLLANAPKARHDDDAAAALIRAA